MSASDTAAPSQGRFQIVVGEVPLAVPRDALLTLEEAAELPRLMGQFTKRDLYLAVKEKALRGYQPRRRTVFTTPDDIDRWIQDSCLSRPDDTASRLASGTTPPRTAGSSSTGRNASTLAVAMAKAEKLIRS